MREIPKRFSQETPHGDYTKHTNPKTGDEIYTLDPNRKPPDKRKLIKVKNPQTGIEEIHSVPIDNVTYGEMGYAILPPEIDVHGKGRVRGRRRAGSRDIDYDLSDMSRGNDKKDKV